MIKSFKCKETEKISRRIFSNKLPPGIQKLAKRKLDHLRAAQSLVELRMIPGNRLEKLSGDRKSQYSIRINDQWRICFYWRGDGAYNVEIIDYH